MRTRGPLAGVWGADVTLGRRMKAERLIALDTRPGQQQKIIPCHRLRQRFMTVKRI